MNRETLFRGKSVETNEWVYGSDIFEKYGNTPYICYFEYGTFVNIKQVEVIPETVGEFTGMTDKNEAKIFEGDIIKTGKFGMIDKVYVVEYDKMLGAFIGSGRNFYFTTFDGDSDQFEVIGNIWDK